MDWQPYRACCPRYAGDSEVGFCPECGHPFLRCHAFAECRSLVTPTDACPVCVAPQLMIDAGAVVQSKAGDRISVPLILLNGSPGGRSIWVKRIVRRDTRGDEALPLTWEQIQPGAERHFTVDTAPLDGGTHTLSVILVIASRYKGLEEEYAFAAGKLITASGPDAQQIIQNIEVSGTGGLVSNQIKGTQATATVGLTDRSLLALERAEKYEIEQGIRGYRDRQVRVPRHVEFAFKGFRSADTPPNGTTIVQGGRLACGRNSRASGASADAAPNDLCLRVYDSRSGEVDEPATLAISRHHFDLIVMNDRVCVQARSTRGLELNGKPMDAGQVAPLQPGDRLVPIPGHADKLAVAIGFATSIGSVDRIEVSRKPAMAS